MSRSNRRAGAVVTGIAALLGIMARPEPAQAQFFFDTWGGTWGETRGQNRYDPWDEDRGGRLDSGPRRYGYEGDRIERARPLDRGTIRAALTRRGYRVEPSIARSSDTYLVAAIDPAGRRVRLVVDAYDATILQRFVVDDPRRISREPGTERWLEDEGLRPPRNIPRERARPAPKKPAATARPAPEVAPKFEPKSEPKQQAPAAQAAQPAPQAPASVPADPAPTASAPRVIPLYKTPEPNPPEGAAPKPEEGPP